MMIFTGELLLNLVIFMGLFCLSAFFSGSETALMAVNRFKLAHLVRQKHKRASTLNKILKEPEKLLGTLLFCNNLVNVALSALGTAVAIKIAGDQGVVYATFIITIGLLIFGEITPKTIAAYYSNSVALIVSPLLELLIKVCYPCVRVLTAASNILIRLLGLKKKSEESTLTDEELEALISTGLDSEVLGREKQDMLLGILFLDKTTLGDIMVPWHDVVCIDVNDDASTVLNVVRRSRFSRYPVYEGDKRNVIGFIHVKDILSELEDDNKEIDIRKILRPPSFAPDVRTIRDQLELFRKERVHICFVVNEYGDVIGLVTLEDVLEEVVGEIEDEHDVSSKQITALPDDSYLVDGSMLIRDLNKRLGMNLPESDVRTVAGLIISTLDRFPEVGEVVVLNGYIFQVVSKRGLSVDKVIIKKKVGSNMQSGDQ